ncbi:hypothetical protein CAAN1_14S03862 [[Candida] anglica]|uniref:Outer spore wall protein 5 n=1 Tax=[Candida] anglica TaxID=148631 RepID=A0ABP0EIH1_9ASCO
MNPLFSFNRKTFKVKRAWVKLAKIKFTLRERISTYQIHISEAICSPAKNLVSTSQFLFATIILISPIIVPIIPMIGIPSILMSIMVAFSLGTFFLIATFLVPIVLLLLIGFAIFALVGSIILSFISTPKYEYVSLLETGLDLSQENASIQSE